jgi:hypothetical protein
MLAGKNFLHDFMKSGGGYSLTTRFGEEIMEKTSLFRDRLRRKSEW